MKNNILIDAERTRYLSGISVVCRNLLKGLSEIPERKFNFTIYADIKKFGSQKRMIFKPWKFWHKLFHSNLNSFDIVHIFHQSSDYFPTKFNGKKILTVHDLNFLHENISESKKNRILKKVTNNLKETDHIVCISNFVKQDFEKNQHLFDLKKLKSIEVIHNGISFPEDKDYNLNSFPFLDQKKYLINIGVLFPKKNQLTLIKMLIFTELHLVLVTSESKSDYEEQILSEIKDLNLEDRVHILKCISDNDKYALLKNCEGLCQPSLAEGFGIPPIEAMYFGKPVFLSTFTSLPEVGGKYAFYFQNFEAKEMAQTVISGLEKYKTQPELKNQLTDWALQFDYKVMANQYHNLYQRILND
ncbi:glycosyltransferase family 4 protein [Epilithonimonas xixisoli]|uniref:Glycosyltransferase involved in cell wall biosynthesis n=1 Tax=Epilithonimonas xixisoli TaxID=1476462 RepID=A0A4R8I353_9FLAO|nr:glycosyltransferase family 1 protein [Epilithonimonas xixisoli]TDX82633.1 glycosyltransferase involved in cell wall biosynthesis [Epilithonimonas xixisoli]